MSEEEVLSLQRVLVKHYSACLKNQLEKDITEKGYTQEDFDRFLNEDS